MYAAAEVDAGDHQLETMIIIRSSKLVLFSVALDKQTINIFVYKLLQQLLPFQVKHKPKDDDDAVYVCM